MSPRVSLIASAALIAIPAVAQVNRPIESQQPTVASEIRRGNDAAKPCARPGVLPTGIDVFTECIERTQSANRQRMSRDFEAFDLGLYLAARLQAQVAISVLKSSARDSGAWEIYVQLYDMRIRQAKEILNVTDEEAARASALGR